MEAFIQISEIAWEHLPRAIRTAIRATCRRGLQLHDKLISHLQVNLYANTVSAAGPLAPTPGQLRRLVSGVLQRGARPRSLALHTVIQGLESGSDGEESDADTAPVPLTAIEREQQL